VHKPLALYVHFPWCVAKCPYCDFNSHPLKPDTDFERYTHALLQDWRSQLNTFTLNQPFNSVFVGGGTPSLLPAELIQEVLQAMPLSATVEITMEANPGTTEYTNFAAYRHAGVNRLSIGAQSFNNSALKQLGRIHQACETEKAFAKARLAGFDNINLDLMWGLPQQTVEDALDDLDAAIALAPEHISWYQLTIEAKTEFARRTPLLPVEDTLAKMESAGLQKLKDAGYLRYEVSAFAQDKQFCQHNLNYWSFGDYVGIGAGAHGKLVAPGVSTPGLIRTTKAHQPRLYLADPEATQTSTIPSDQLVVEFMLNALRLVDGVDFSTFSTNTGLPWQAVAHMWEPLVEQGLVRADRCATTPLGLRYLDSVVAEFLT
jgi:putative oxygen-independent coproporphyrinogen III oxidase